MPNGKRIRYDPNARSSDPDRPGFIARPADAPAYHGFPVVAETATDGWVYGAITECDGVEPQTEGDGYVIAPMVLERVLHGQPIQASFMKSCRPTKSGGASTGFASRARLLHSRILSSTSELSCRNSRNALLNCGGAEHNGRVAIAGSGEQSATSRASARGGLMCRFNTAGSGKQMP